MDNAMLAEVLAAYLNAESRAHLREVAAMPAVGSRATGVMRITDGDGERHLVMIMDDLPEPIYRAERPYPHPLPAHPCRVMDTRGCPPSYAGVCGDRPCARFESDDPAPWI